MARRPGEGKLVRVETQEHRELSDRLWLELTYDDIDVNVVREFVNLPDCGAQVVFSGQTRDHSTLLENVTHLEYSAYESYVLPVFAEIATPLLEEGEIRRIVIIHKLGRVDLKQTSVVVAVCSAHRRVAFAGCERLIDQLKLRAPIWKKEFSDTDSVWGKVCDH